MGNLLRIVGKENQTSYYIHHDYGDHRLIHGAYLSFTAALLWADVVLEYSFFFMQDYLTDVWGISFTHAAAILNIWGGIYRILPIFFLFLADAILGNFTMLTLTAISSNLGILLITIPTLPMFGNSSSCKEIEGQCVGDTEKVVFYMGMILIAVGRAGLETADSLGEEQRNEARDIKLSAKFFVSLLLYTPAIGFFAFPYIKKWFVLFGVSAICTALATIYFLSGCRTFVKAKPRGSPITDICRVFVAAAWKRSKPFPGDDKELYVKDDDPEEAVSDTRFLRCLEKAAIILPGTSPEGQKKKRWRLCSVAEVEAAKTVIRMVPMWATFIICATVSSIGNTYFVEQASHMNRKLGKWNVPPQILLLIFKYGKVAFNGFAATVLFWGKNGPRIGIGVGMAFSILCCAAAAGLETRRLGVIRSHGLLEKPDAKIPMSAYWLLFQFVLLGGLESFFEQSVAAFYEDQSPASVRKYVECFGEGVLGLGFMGGVLSVHVVGRISETGGTRNWFHYNLNQSRLDRYYWVLAGLCSVNLVLFTLVALGCRYRNHTPLDHALSEERISMALDLFLPQRTAQFIKRHMKIEDLFPED